MKIRGNPNQIFDKYQSLARDATTLGDRVMAENYLQHAEHYYRIFTENNAQRQQQQNRQQQRQDGPDQPVDTAAETPEDAPQDVPQEAPQEAVVEKKEPIVDVPNDPTNEPQPVIE